MTLKSWLENHWIEAHDTSTEEISDLLSIVDRDLKDARLKGLILDARMGFSYNATLQLGTIALAAAGYRAAKQRQHERTIQSLAHTVGVDAKTIDIIDIARRKRHASHYDHAGVTSSKEADEMHKLAAALRATVIAWLEKHHPELLE